MAFQLELFLEVLGTTLLFGLVFGMSATVDIECLRMQIKNVRAIGLGLFLQFVVMPFLGFLVVKFFDFGHSTGLILLVVTSSPGGSYSNWFCSIFNGDLALSVAMTAISTMASTIMLPLNLYVYARMAYNDDGLASLDWSAVLLSLSLVICAIASGLLASAHYKTADFHLLANRIGNISGIALVLFSAIMSNSDADTRLWAREWEFYVGVALPCIVGLLIANAMSVALNLLRPEQVTVSVECCIQNCGIAVSLSLALFDGENLAKAIAVPFYYGMIECAVITTYCWAAWKSSWTKAPVDISAWKMISTSYEILNIPTDDGDDDDGFDKDLEKDGFHYVDAKEATPPSVIVGVVEKDGTSSPELVSKASI